MGSKQQALQTFLLDDDANTTAFKNISSGSSQMIDAPSSTVNTNK